MPAVRLSRTINRNLEIFANLRIFAGFASATKAHMDLYSIFHELSKEVCLIFFRENSIELTWVFSHHHGRVKNRIFWMYRNMETQNRVFLCFQHFMTFLWRTVPSHPKYRNRWKKNLKNRIFGCTEMFGWNLKIGGYLLLSTFYIGFFLIFWLFFTGISFSLKFFPGVAP